MKDSLFAIVALIWIVQSGIPHQQKSTVRLKARSSAFDIEPQDAFIDLPKSTTDPEINHYQKVELEKSFSYPMDLYCLSGDPKFCLFFDKKGHLAGIQLSYPKEDVANVDTNIYNFSNPNFDETYIYGKPCYSVRIYLKNPRELEDENEECETSANEQLPGDSLNNRDGKETNDLTEDCEKDSRKNKLTEEFEGLWAVLDGQLEKIDAMFQPDSSAITKGGFDMQGCIPRIGLAYVRGFHETSICRNGFFLYLLYEDGALVGFGHFIPGKLSPGPGKDMFNIPDGPEVEQSIPYPPPCFKEMRQYGLTATNIYLIEDPWNIRCNKCYCDRA